MIRLMFFLCTQLTEIMHLDRHDISGSQVTVVGSHAQNAL